MILRVPSLPWMPWPPLAGALRFSSFIGRLCRGILTAWRIFRLCNFGYTTMFWLKKIVSVLILPPLGPLLLAAIGLLLLPRRVRLGMVLAWSGVLSALGLSAPFVVSALVGPLERTPVLDLSAARSAQAIVILSGGKRSNAPEYGGETVNRLTLERVRYGARISRQTGLPILLSGGAPSSGIAEALLMRDALERDFGLRAHWTEAASRDTRENARYSAEILKRAGMQRVVLVTHAAHMRRAQAEFAQAGIETVAAPTGFLGGSGAGNTTVFDYLPSAASAYAGWITAHEWLGNLARKVGVDG